MIVNKMIKPQQMHNLYLLQPYIFNNNCKSYFSWQYLKYNQIKICLKFKKQMISFNKKTNSILMVNTIYKHQELQDYKIPLDFIYNQSLQKYLIYNLMIKDLMISYQQKDNLEQKNINSNRFKDSILCIKQIIQQNIFLSKICNKFLNQMQKTLIQNVVSQIQNQFIDLSKKQEIHQNQKNKFKKVILTLQSIKKNGKTNLDEIFMDFAQQIKDHLCQENIDQRFIKPLKYSCNYCKEQNFTCIKRKRLHQKKCQFNWKNNNSQYPIQMRQSYDFSENQFNQYKFRNKKIKTQGQITLKEITDDYIFDNEMVMTKKNNDDSNQCSIDQIYNSEDQIQNLNQSGFL